MHYAFDAWMGRNYPHIPFERYADDAVVHCKSGEGAQRLKDAIGARLLECGLELHPDKTKIVYCQDSNRRRGYADVKFDFLGFGFQPRQSKSRWGILFLNFSPAISAKAAKSIRQTIRSWKIHRWTHLSIEELAAWINPILRGWINYYGQYYKSLLTPVLGQLDYALVRWAKRKYRRLKVSHSKARAWIKGVAQRQPRLFAHWQITLQPTTGQ